MMCATWDGSKLNRTGIATVLLVAALEARSKVDGIQMSPHIMLVGEAGCGKTILGKILFPKSVASNLPMDSEGVGQATMDIGHNVMKIDDAGQSTLLSKRIVDMIKTCYQNQWSAKEHGSRQHNAATLIWITTNVPDPLLLMSLNGDTAPLERRFMKVTMKKNKRLQLGEIKKFTEEKIDEAIHELMIQHMGNWAKQGQIEQIMKHHRFLEVVLYEEDHEKLETLRKQREKSPDILEEDTDEESEDEIPMTQTNTIKEIPETQETEEEEFIREVAETQEGLEKRIDKLYKYINSQESQDIEAMEMLDQLLNEQQLKEAVDSIVEKKGEGGPKIQDLTTEEVQDLVTQQFVMNVL